MSALATIHEINACDALVDAGVHWSAILEASLPFGLSPPTLNDYIELSVGGTLSVGGIGGQAFKSGLLVDNVLEMDVVTGAGHLVTCSPFQNEDLLRRGALEASASSGSSCARGCASSPSRRWLRAYSAVYADLESLTEDQLTLIDDGRFDYVEGTIAPNTPAGWAYVLSVAKYFDPASPPNDAALLAGLSYIPGTESSTDSTYFDFANSLASFVTFLMEVGAWTTAHPWLNLFIPAQATVPFVTSALDEITTDTLGYGVILLYPLHRDRITAPFAPPASVERPFAFSVLGFPISPTPAQVTAIIAQNAGALPRVPRRRRQALPDRLGADDPRRLGGAARARCSARSRSTKARFDPNNVLTPGQGIF